MTGIELATATEIGTVTAGGIEDMTVAVIVIASMTEIGTVIANVAVIVTMIAPGVNERWIKLTVTVIVTIGVKTNRKVNRLIEKNVSAR